MLVIVGPTGIGKTRAAFEVARQLGGEVLVADSRQAYSRLHIATNHPPAEYRRQVRYHGIQFADPISEVVNVHDFLRLAAAAIADAQSRAVPIVVEGGTMLWVDALTEGYDLARAAPDPERRRQLRALSVEQLSALVLTRDPGAEVDLRNPARLVRAVEILEAHGPPLAASRGRLPPRWRFPRAGLESSMTVIESRLAERCKNQVERGLVRETIEALAAGVPREHPVLTGIGYAQALDLIEGRITEAELPQRMLQANRRYARRQLRWFKRQPQTTWFEAEPDPVPGILRWLETTP